MAKTTNTGNTEGRDEVEQVDFLCPAGVACPLVPASATVLRLPSVISSPGRTAERARSHLRIVTLTGCQVCVAVGNDHGLLQQINPLGYI
jgi:hypothetical protein